MSVRLDAAAARLAPINDFLSELHHQLGDVGYAILLSAVLLVCLALVIAIIIYFELYSWWW
jgi:hypothetical protein